MEIQEPKIDQNKIQDAANEAAEKAFIKTIEGYYSGYDSPYKKALQEELKKQETTFSFTLPNVMAKINDALTNEVDAITNAAIAQSYIPMVSSALVGIDKDQNMSDLLKALVEDINPDSEEYEEFEFSYEENLAHEWLNCEITTDEGNYEFTLHKSYGKSTYQLLSLPGETYQRVPQKTMTIWKDEVKIEMPFTSNILRDKVMMMFSRILLSRCEITMDCGGFDPDWIDRNECHC